MGQTFQLVAPRARMAVPWGGKLGEILFDGSAKDLVDLLAVPVRPSYLRRRSLEATVVPPTAGDDKADTNCSVTFSGLPTEVHRHIFAHVESIKDAILFGLTSRYFWSIGRERMHDIYLSLLGRWAGKNIVCVGEDVKPDDYPPGLFSAEELDVLRKDWADICCSDYPDEEVPFPDEPLRLVHFTSPIWSEMVRPVSVRQESLLIRGSDSVIDIISDPMYASPRSELSVRDEHYFPEDQPWILRNLTTKQFVRSEAIALTPRFIHGPHIEVLGFGEVVMSRICWSTSSSVSMSDTTNISRGVWAGHRFDVTTLARHEDETRGVGWSDVSNEVAKEIADIWESEYGANWREVILGLV
ncbi:hypothetical protein F5X99DRAFT_229613 [Biscogniauxia marginata]|nr:hypothetical protein F5X99DRAFT_229613 [Biscogniauxia marginata]